MKKKIIQKIMTNCEFYDSLSDRENVDVKCYVCHNTDIVCGFGYDIYNICITCAQKYKYLNKRKSEKQIEKQIENPIVKNDIIILPANMPDEYVANVLNKKF